MWIFQKNAKKIKNTFFFDFLGDGFLDTFFGASSSDSDPLLDEDA